MTTTLNMPVNPRTKVLPCPQCQTPVERPRVMLHGTEIFRNLPCLCDLCDQSRTAEAATRREAITFRHQWARLVPEDYQAAVPERVRRCYSKALDWKPRGQHKGVGIYGPSGTGKTHAMALLVLALELPFRWITGARMRQLANDAATMDGATREDARKELSTLRDVQLLVIDDLAEVKFTAAWADKLFEILEHRNSTRRLTCWTAQHGIGQLAGKITGNGVDSGTGDAIERRLTQHHALFHS